MFERMKRRKERKESGQEESGQERKEGKKEWRDMEEGSDADTEIR